MINIADIIVIILILVATFRGYKKGFIKTGFGLLSLFIALAITFMFHQTAVEYVKENTGVEEWISNYLYNLDVNETISGDKFEDDEKVVLSESGENFINNLPQAIVDLIGLDEIKENAKITIVEKIVDFTVRLLAFIVVYIITKLVLTIIVFILDSIAKLPVIKQFNELLGLILGIVLGFIQVYFICAIITLISSLAVVDGVIVAINNSMFAHFLYDNNLLLQILF